MKHNRTGILARLSAACSLVVVAGCSSQNSNGQNGTSTTVVTGGSSGIGGTTSDTSRSTGGTSTSSSNSQNTGGSSTTASNTGGSSPSITSVTGGNGSTGGTKSTGGTRSMGGGTSSAGGRSATGGKSSTGGSNSGDGGTSPSTGGSSTTSSTFSIDVQTSTAIPTVGVVTWSLSASLDSATIEFGRDQSNFEFQAPADLAASNHRSLLLGMKPNTTYYVRVTAKSGGQTYVSQVASIKTGYLPNGLPVQKITDKNAGALYAGGGFTIACAGYTSTGGVGVGTSTTPGVVFIFDRDGTNVWSFNLQNTAASACTRARMSLDGKYMWVGNFGNTTADGALMRIPMDGLGTPDVYNLPGRSHDFAVLPDEHIVYFIRDDGGSAMMPESIKELDPTTGNSKLIYAETTDFGDLFDSRGGHTNQVNYVPALNAIAFSMYFINTVALISYPEGKLLATFGGDKSTFSNMTWNGQHGHDVYSDHISIFNNNGSNGGASVLRFQYNLQSKTATAQTSYSSGLASPAFGDVKELPNGNYFVTYSTASTMQEIDSSLNLLREIGTSVTIAYTEHRSSMYGKPPPYDR